MAEYAVQVLNDTGAPVALLDGVSLTTLRVERKLNDVSVAQFTLQADHPAAAHLGKHAWFEVWRYPVAGERQHEGTYMVVLLDRSVDDNGLEWLIVAGFSFEFLLLQRVVDPRNDPLMAGGWSTKYGPVDDLMAELVYEQAGRGASAHNGTPSQQVPYLEVAPTASVGDPVPFRKAWDGLLPSLQELAAGDRMDFRIERGMGTGLVFYAERVGEDRSKTTNFPGGRFVLLTPELGTLARPRLVRDWRQEKTVVVLLGHGAGDAREFFGSMAANAQETPYSVAVAVEDLRQAESASEYIAQAQAALAKNAAHKEFSFEVAQGATHYHELFELGDFVTVAWGEYEQDMRVIGVEIEVREGQERITPKVRERYGLN